MARKRNVDLEDELSENGVDLTEEEANDARQPREAAPPPAPNLGTTAPNTGAPPLVSMSIADIQALVKTAVEAAQGGNKEIAAIVTQGIAQARKPIPEQTDADYPRISVLNPLGERDHPRPGLKCEVFLGTREPKSQTVQRSYGFLAEDLSAQEQIALNTLEPMSATIQLLDESKIKVEIVATRDEITNEIRRLVIMVPLYVIQKGSQHKNMLPSICNMVEQLTGRNFAKLSADDLAWFMAEHRKKNYVAEREAVAA